MGGNSRLAAVAGQETRVVEEGSFGLLDMFSFYIAGFRQKIPHVGRRSCQEELVLP